uniref:Xanthine dehydrogenase, molybdenum binding subunit apoprotein n=1 Tax=Candidatus Kentrum sp. LPFa TaxID=2126335 RepID=A0A450WWB3_9GAMM|nr:MAG: xanthine dehydrogenase, molybdenum binding subunit apoprotein [Candidatus Kentron sp. LPFa]
MKNIDIALHVRGESRFVNDMRLPDDALHGAVLSSPIAHGRFSEPDVTAARGMAGIHGVFTARDIPGKNRIGSIADDPLLADGEVVYVGQPIAIVVGESAELARAAAQKIAIAFQALPAIFDAREAHAQGQLIVPSVTSSLGNTEDVWEGCDVVVEGVAESGAQEHVYLETQGAIACPTESGGLRVTSSTQSPKTVQSAIATVLGIPMHRIEVDVARLGGGFGGKEEQASLWAAAATLAAFKLKRPVKLVLHRDEDIRMTGKRHPYSSDFKIGLAHDGRILAYEATFYQDAGAIADLSASVLERSLLQATGSYFIPNVKLTGFSCRTNLPSNTAFRGFGAPQSVFVLESAICKAAAKMGVEPAFIQKRNLLRDGDEFHYGMKVANSQAYPCWEKAEKTYGLAEIHRNARAFNGKHPLWKKGISMIPICHGVAFEKAIFLNQASALVHIYSDGSVSISTGAIEMGQGVNMKMRRVAAYLFSLPLEKIKIESTNTTRVANSSPTASSFTADLNGNATRLACLEILARLEEFAARRLGAQRTDEIEIREGAVYLQGEPKLTWEELILDAYLDRINLSAQAHYATPNVHFDKDQDKGEYFAYYVFGVAIVEATVDCLRGTYRIDSVKVAHDLGQSLDPAIDLGQIEGGVVQGLGWATMEEIMHDEKGCLISDTLATYKVPDIHFAPREIRASFLENTENPLGIFNSKAIGEPPFLYGIGAYFAILQAMQAYRPDLQMKFSLPMTPEKVLVALCGEG